MIPLDARRSCAALGSMESDQEIRGAASRGSLFARAKRRVFGNRQRDLPLAALARTLLRPMCIAGCPALPGLPPRRSTLAQRDLRGMNPPTRLSLPAAVSGSLRGTNGSASGHELADERLALLLRDRGVGGSPPSTIDDHVPAIECDLGAGLARGVAGGLRGHRHIVTIGRSTGAASQRPGAPSPRLTRTPA